MQEKIKELHKLLQNISADLLKYQIRSNLEEIEKIIPQIQEFAMWFLETNRFGIEDDLYQGMCKNLVKILEDIMRALKEEDRVLLFDAVEYGIIEYLKLFDEAK